MKTRFASKLLLLAVLQAFVCNATFAQEPVSSPPVPAKPAAAGARQKFAHGMTRFCERLLIGFEKHVPEPLRKPIIAAGYLTGVIPVAKVLSNADKTFFVLVETPLMGLLSTPVSVEVANAIGGHGAAFDAKFLQTTEEQYVSYQTSNVVRNGATIDDSISPSTRVWLNWWYSTALYSWQTAGSKILHATTHLALVHGWSLVGFAAAWPLFSQRVSQYILTPILFSKFPKESMLKKIHDTSRATESLAAEQEAAMVDARKALADLGPKTRQNKDAYDKAKAKLTEAKYGMKWLKWFREGVGDGQAIPKATDVKYWSIKSSASMSAAVSMVTVYLLLRRALVGGEGEDTIMHEMFERIMGCLGIADGYWKKFESRMRDEVLQLMEEYKGQENFVPVFPDEVAQP